MNDKEKYMKKEQHMRAAINAKLIETGERERLRDLLQQKLIECGWRDQIKTECKDIVKKRGLDNITVDELVSEIVPRGRALVPDPIKKELLSRIRTFLAEQSDL